MRACVVNKHAMLAHDALSPHTNRTLWTARTAALVCKVVRGGVVSTTKGVLHHIRCAMPQSRCHDTHGTAEICVAASPVDYPCTHSMPRRAC